VSDQQDRRIFRACQVPDSRQKTSMTPADLRAERIARGWTQEFMACRLNRSVSTVRKWERGYTPYWVWLRLALLDSKEFQRLNKERPGFPGPGR